MHGVLLDTSAVPPNTQWAAAALAVLTIIYIVFVRPAKGGKKKDPLARGPSDAMLAQQRAVERDMTALLVEYEQVIRTMSAQLETRVAKLDLLCREADEKLAALRAAAARAGGSPAMFAAAGAALPAKSDDSGAGFEVPPEPAAPADEPPRHADVYALADQGLGYRQIAHKLDRPYGEIELILALRPKAAPRAAADDAARDEPQTNGAAATDEDEDEDANASSVQPVLAASSRDGELHRSPGSHKHRRPNR